MLHLTLRVGDRVVIGEGSTATVLTVVSLGGRGRRVRLGFQSDRRAVLILREELRNRAECMPETKGG